jgi:hypothetical protein
MRISYRDLVELRSLAIRCYVEQPPRLEVPGMPETGLGEEGRRALAWLEAARVILERQGARAEDGPLVPGGERASVWEG